MQYTNTQDIFAVKAYKLIRQTLRTRPFPKVFDGMLLIEAIQKNIQRDHGKFNDVTFRYLVDSDLEAAVNSLSTQTETGIRFHRLQDKGFVKAVRCLVDALIGEARHLGLLTFNDMVASRNFYKHIRSEIKILLDLMLHYADDNINNDHSLEIINDFLDDFEKAAAAPRVDLKKSADDWVASLPTVSAEEHLKNIAGRPQSPSARFVSRIGLICPRVASPVSVKRDGSMTAKKQNHFRFPTACNWVSTNTLSYLLTKRNPKIKWNDQRYLTEGVAALRRGVGLPRFEPSLPGFDFRSVNFIELFAWLRHCKFFVDITPRGAPRSLEAAAERLAITCLNFKRLTVFNVTSRMRIAAIDFIAWRIRRPWPSIDLDHVNFRSSDFVVYALERLHNLKFPGTLAETDRLIELIDKNKDALEKSRLNIEKQINAETFAVTLAEQTASKTHRLTDNKLDNAAELAHVSSEDILARISKILGERPTVWVPNSRTDVRRSVLSLAPDGLLVSSPPKAPAAPRKAKKKKRKQTVDAAKLSKLNTDSRIKSVALLNVSPTKSKKDIFDADDFLT